MSGPSKQSSFNVRIGLRFFYIVINLIAIMGGSSGKSATDSEEGESMGYHCKDEPRCICLTVWDQKSDVIVCEEKVILHRFWTLGLEVYYDMECMGETEVDPYHYLSMILFANLSTYTCGAKKSDHLTLSNCSAPSGDQSDLLGAGSKDYVDCLRSLSLEALTIHCKETETFHLFKHHWSGLKNLKILLVSCPKLSEVDENLLSGISKQLEHLQLSDTEVRDLPERFFSNMEKMKHLDLRRNRLRSFRRGFLNSTCNLEILYLGENEIESIDDDIFLKTEKLIRLGLAKNSLTTLPTSLCSLRKLRSLHAEYNRISFIPQECLYGLSYLSRIYLSGNKLVTLGLASKSITSTYKKILSSDKMFHNSSSMLEKSGNLNYTFMGTTFIRYLILDNNSLSFLPDEALYRMRGLEFLDISRNRIAYLPENILSRNKNLTKLLASNNLFTHIPVTLLRYKTRLSTLDLSHNLIETLDLDFFSSPLSLCYIYINNNRIRKLPDNIFQPLQILQAECKESVLDMSGNFLEDVPQLSIPWLTNLSLSGNNLTFIKPEMLSQAPRLLELNLSHNLIRTIDAPLQPGEDNIRFSKSLVNLQVIDISSNQLTVLPNIYSVAATLKHLNVSRNYITELVLKPETPTKHSPSHLQLETFDMSRNRLKSVEFFDHMLWDPVYFYQWHFAKMKHVDLSHNRIDLKGCIEYMHPDRFVWGCISPLHRLAALEVIILSHNHIAYVPMEFQHFLPNLRFVDLSHNKIKRLWHGDLLFTRARDTMDLEVFRMKHLGEFDPHAFRNQFPGSNNLTIDLSHNSIASVQLPDDKIGVVIPGCDIGSQFSRVKLLLGHNPFLCDCEVFKLLRYASLEMRPVSALERLNGHMLVVPAVIDIQDLHCSKPDSINGKAVAEVDSWAYHWLPMIGICWNHLGVQSVLEKGATKPPK